MSLSTGKTWGKRSIDLRLALDKSVAWLASNGWAGYDPYDVRGTSFFRRLNRNWYTSTGFKAISFLSPLVLRRLLRIPKMVNAKAVALIAHAYLNLYAMTDRDDYLDEAQKALIWLETHSSPGYSGPCWGYPFDWDARTFIPACTPSSVVTSIAVEAFLRAHELLGDRHYLKVVRGCADFVVHDLNQDCVSSDALCFSYTPLDHWHVHNANLFSCATLARVGQLIGTHEWDDLIQQGTGYTLNAQRNDGGWYYWGPPDQMLYIVDHYHTGYVLRCLDSIERTMRMPGISDAIKRGYHFYKQTLFTRDGVPKYTEHDLYPIDIHSCAEAIICLVTLRNRFPDAVDRARRVAQWTVEHMLAADGHFYYRRYPYLVIRIPFVRWSQAWMLRALTSLLLMDSS
jgi:rhamnogalacturonyl hydrolase YesR